MKNMEDMDFKEPTTIKECDNYLKLISICLKINPDPENQTVARKAIDMLLDKRNELSNQTT